MNQELGIKLAKTGVCRSKRPLRSLAVGRNEGNRDGKK